MDTGTVVEVDPKKPLIHSPWDVITVTGTAARRMYCVRTCTEGNSIRAISKKYDPASAVCGRCRFGKACQEYMAYKH